MKSFKSYDEHHCSRIEKEKLKADLAHCDATYSSKSDLGTCYLNARRSSEKREYACMYS